MKDSTTGSRVVAVTTTVEAQELAKLLHSPHRGTPVAVLTRPAGQPASYIDASELLDHVGDVVDVYLMGTGEVSVAFANAMPDMTQVYGGAGRIYPVGHEWVHNPRRSPLRFAFTAHEGRSSTQLLIEDALTMASAAGLIGTGGRTASRPETASGEVKVLAAGRGVVRLDSGGFASVVEGLLLPGVPIERILRKGMRLSGAVDPHRRLDIRASLREAASCVAGLREGDPVLARVESVLPDSAVLALHPALGIALGREDVTPNELDDLTTLFSEGEVVVAHVETTGPDWRLRMWDVDDDEIPLPAPALIKGGPPWLLPAAPTLTAADRMPEHDSAPLPPTSDTRLDEERSSVLPTSDLPLRALEPFPAPARPAAPTPRSVFGPPSIAKPTSVPRPPTPSSGPVSLPSRAHELDALRADLAGLREEVRGLREEHRLLISRNEELERRAEQRGTEVRGLRTKLRKASAGTPPRRAAALGQFTDAAEQFHHEVYLAWVERVPAGEKSAQPLAEYRLGPDFLKSLEELQGVSRAKVVDVVCEVVTGLVWEMGGREVHQLRSGRGGDDPVVTRADGATCWRAALQVNTPSARRLHFWQVPGGVTELSRVCLHDETRP